MVLTQKERIEGGLWGLLVGDALGVPYEFKDPSEIPPFDAIEMTPPADFPRTYSHVPPGTWSDDGAQALCLLASLRERHRMDLDDFGRRLLRWLDEGYMAVGGHVFDVGIQTRTALGNLRSGVPASQSGLSGEYNNGNGSLMRCLPVLLAFPEATDSELVELAHTQSLVTHAHPRSMVCCALYILWARRELPGKSSDAWKDAATALAGLYPAGSSFAVELEAHVRPFDSPQGKGTGYVVDALHSARLACMEHDYESIVRRAVSLGNDTDTTACIAGGIAGIRHGANGIPARWMEQMRDTAMVAQLL